MDETKAKSKNSSKPIATNKEKKMIKRRRRIQIHNPSGVVQRIKPRKRNAILSTEIDENPRNEEESEEFDSDQHIENLSDWHDELDVIRMPHLLGPSATKHSPVPVHFQHCPAPPQQFRCYKILVQCNQFHPIFTNFPCTDSETFNHVFRI